VATHESRAFLIAYDIAEPKRLVRVHRFLTRHAMALQYSVFAGVLTPFQVAAAVAGLQERIDAREDDVRIYPLPRKCYALTLGAQWTPEGVFLTDRRLMELWRTRLAGHAESPPEAT
jgi:CRISPR-associated protein Cas2